MALSNQILRSRCQYGALHETEFLDLSNLGLVILERLTSYPKLQSLILRGNKLQDAAGLDCCKQLWYLDLSNNMLESLEGLAQFLALGTLVLSNNNLDWSNLASIRHMHILSISLHGNPLLEKDPYYRIHVVDCLPNVWMLDGRIVTSAERIKTKHFFQDSALSKKPVRQKLKKNGFIPSGMKNINISGIFGEKAIQLMTSFPNNAVLNIETDKKRLLYLAQNIQEDINLEHRYTSSSRHCAGHVQKQKFLLDALEARLNNRAEGNMLLLLLVASLEFVLPTRLVKETLIKNNVHSSRQRSFQAMDLFLLPKSFRCRVVSILFSALNIDWDENEDTNLYPQLFLCLYHITQQLTKFNETMNYPVLKSTSKSRLQLHDYKCMLALQVVQMMCFTPVFFDFLADDVGVLNLVKLAIGDSDFVDQLTEFCKLPKASSTSMTVQETVHEKSANLLLLKVHERLQTFTNKSASSSACDRILCKAGALPMKGEASSVRKAEYLNRGAAIPDDRPPSINPHKTSAKVQSKVPNLGDAVLLGPQTVGKILTLPQSTLALVLLDAVPVASGAVEHKLKKSDSHYAYVNIHHLEWDNQLGMWKPLGTFCDKLTTETAINNFEESGQDGALPASHSCQESLSLCHSLCTPAVLPGKSKNNQHPRPATSVCKKLGIVHHFRRRVQSATPSTSCKMHVKTSNGAPLLTSSTEMTVATTVLDEKIHARMFEKTEENGALKITEGLSVNSIPKTTSFVASVDLRSLQGELADECDPKDHTSLDKDTDTDRNVISGINTESQRGEDKNTEENEQVRGPDTSSKPNAIFITAEHEEETKGKEDGKYDVQTAQRSQQNTLDFTTPLSLHLHKLGSCNCSNNVENMKLETISTQPESERNFDFYSEFEQQRINAWKKTTPSSGHKAGMQSAPPPQPPSSPVVKDHGPNSHRENADCLYRSHILKNMQIFRPLGVTDAGLWLGGGRDVYWKDVTRRPRSSHVPGWKIGLPTTMKKRPKSGASQTSRYSKTGSIPAQLFRSETDALSCVMDGDELPDLNDRSYPLQSYLGGRRMDSQRSVYDEDPLPGPVYDNVASPMVVWSYNRPFSSGGCLPYLVEKQWNDDEDFHSNCNPSCATPEFDFLNPRPGP